MKPRTRMPIVTLAAAIVVAGAAGAAAVWNPYDLGLGRFISTATAQAVQSLPGGAPSINAPAPGVTQVGLSAPASAPQAPPSAAAPPAPQSTVAPRSPTDLLNALGDNAPGAAPQPAALPLPAAPPAPVREQATAPTAAPAAPDTAQAPPATAPARTATDPAPLEAPLPQDIGAPQGAPAAGRLVTSSGPGVVHPQSTVGRIIRPGFRRSYQEICE